MAQIVNGQVQLSNGQMVTPQTGGWYDGQQYWGGALSNPGQFNSQNNQAGQQGGAAPVQNQADAAYLASRGDTSAPSRVVNNGAGSPPVNGGGGGGNMNMPQAPAFDLVGATNAAYNTPEIGAANKAVADANTELSGRQQALADAQAGINDNPFYSEATRVGKSQQLTQQANNDMTVIQNKVVTAQNQVASLKADAAIKVNAALGQYNINRAAYQDTLQQFNMILQAGGLSNASPQDLANYAASTGISMSVLQGMQQQEKDNNTKTQIIPSTDNNGNVTITAVDSKTGQIISQTSAGDISTTKKGTGSGTSAKQQQVELKSGVYSDLKRLSAPDTGFVSKEDWAKVKQNAINQGYDPSQFNSDMAGFTNPSGSKNGYNYI